MKCKICESTESVKTTYLDTCVKCGHGYREYPNDIIEYHATEYRKNFTRTSNEFDKDGKVTQRFHDARKTIVENRLAIIKKYLDTNSTVLDIGSGAGTFAKIILPHVKSVECLELDKSLVDECKRLNFKTIYDSFEDHKFDSKYDIIFAWHVLEHIDDINNFIEKCKGLSTGYIIMEVPTKRPAHEKFDGHLHYFTENSLELLFKNHGLQLIEMCAGVQHPAALAVFKKIK